MPRRRQDRWYCTRAEPCTPGPLPNGDCAHRVQPCVPTISVRAKRGKAVIWAVALSAGIVALLLLGKHPQLIDAGPVSQAHSVLGEDCSSCHSNHEKGMLHWLVSATSPATTLADNGQCLSCHEGTGHSENAHGESPQWLSEAYEPLENTDASKPWQLSLLCEVGFSENSDDPLACATCHQEHRGPHHELAEMDNLKCQGCHQIQFRDFEHGHPEFKNYPPTGTASISFDHRTHFGKHFTSGDLPSEAPPIAIVAINWKTRGKTS